MSVCRADDSPWCFPGDCKDCDGARNPDTRPHAPAYIKTIAKELVDEHGQPDTRAAMLAFWIDKNFR